MGVAAEARRLRLHDLREVRRRRRHVARQHLPGRGVRRAVAPLLVLVRAEPVVEPHLRDPAGDPRLPRALHRSVRRAPARPHRHRRSPRPRWDEAEQHVAARDGRRRGVHGRRRGQRPRHAERARSSPTFAGADRFRGRMFHSSRWDHSKSLAGERVASIGTGASAIQYVPAIAPEVEHLTVFQRSPIWITPRLDRAVHARAAAPLRARAVRGPASPLADLVDLRAGELRQPTPSRPMMQTALGALLPRAQDRATPSCAPSSRPTIPSVASGR